MPRIIGVTKVRKSLAEIVNRADEHGEPIYLTNFNQPLAVLIGYQAFERLEERLEELEDMVAIYAGREEPTRPFEEAWTELEQEASDHEQTPLPVAAGPIG